MRIPQPRTTSRVSLNKTRASGTQPSQARAAGGTTGPQGSPGGRRIGTPGTGGPRILGQEVYLWILVLVEAVLTGALRRFFRRFHGG